MVKPINWGGMLEPYLQPLKERLGILPFGQYEDGNVRLAWPGLLADPVQHGMRAAETPIPPVDDDAAWAAKSRDMFDAAGLATTGALGAGLAGGMADNALGSAAKTLEKPQGMLSDGYELLPERYQIAKKLYDAGQSAPEKGADGVFYRGVDYADAPTTPHRNEWWASDSPRVAASYSTSGADGAAPAVYPSRFDFKNALSVDGQGAGFESIPFEGRLSGTDEIAKAARERGHDGVIFQNIIDDGGTGNLPSNVVAALRPGTVFSATTGDLLYSNAKSGAAVPLAIDAAESQAPQGIRAYHGGQTRDYRTGQEYTELNSQNGPWSAFFSDDPNVANRFAGSYSDGAGVFPVDLRLQNPRVIDAQGRPASEFQFDQNKGWNWAAQDRKTGEISRDAQGFSELFPYTDEFRAAITDPNADGVILQNTKDEGNVYIPTKRGTVYSATTGDLLYSNAPTGAAIPLGMEGQEQDPQTLTTANILRLLRGQ